MSVECFRVGTHLATCRHPSKEDQIKINGRTMRMLSSALQVIYVSTVEQHESSDIPLTCHHRSSPLQTCRRSSRSHRGCIASILSNRALDMSPPDPTPCLHPIPQQVHFCSLAIFHLQNYRIQMRWRRISFLNVQVIAKETTCKKQSSCATQPFLKQAKVSAFHRQEGVLRNTNHPSRRSKGICSLHCLKALN